MVKQLKDSGAPEIDLDRAVSELKARKKKLADKVSISLFFKKRFLKDDSWAFLKKSWIMFCNYFGILFLIYQKLREKWKYLSGTGLCTERAAIRSDQNGRYAEKKILL